MDINDIKETIENHNILMRRAEIILRKLGEKDIVSIRRKIAINVGSNFDELNLMTIYYTIADSATLGELEYINVPLELFFNNGHEELTKKLNEFIERKIEEKKAIEERRNAQQREWERKEYERLKAIYGKED